VNKETIKRIIKTFFIFLWKYVLVPAQAIVAIATIFVIMKTNAITDTANLLHINDAIQQRTDIVIAVDLKEKELNTFFENSGTFDVDKVKNLNAERWAAVASLLNTYEFACDQYNNNKIDKKSFKTFYEDLIKYIKTNPDYSAHFNTSDGKAKYQAINDVYKEWYGDNTH